MNTMLKPLTLINLLMFALMAGFFYAFSVTVMPGLDQVSHAAAIEAMQGINRAVRNPVFFITFFLSPVLAFALAAMAWFAKKPAVAALLAFAGAAYVAGVIVPTSTINVPMNNALATVDASAAAAQVWQDYSSQWTLWNTLRTLPSLLATGLATIALMRTAQKS